MCEVPSVVGCRHAKPVVVPFYAVCEVQLYDDKDAAASSTDSKSAGRTNVSGTVIDDFAGHPQIDHFVDVNKMVDEKETGAQFDELKQLGLAEFTKKHEL